MSKHLCIIHQTCGDKPCPLCAIPTGPVSAKEVRDLPKKILAPSLPAVPDTKEEELDVIVQELSEQIEAAKINVRSVNIREEFLRTIKPLIRASLQRVLEKKEEPSDHVKAVKKVLGEPGAVAANTVQGPMELQAWQPIETAPVNQSVLVFLPNQEHYGPGVYRALRPHFGELRPWQITGLHFGRDCDAVNQPTHWMPLPAPPVPLNDAGEASAAVGHGTPVATSKIPFETGGRNALNLQMALIEAARDIVDNYAAVQTLNCGIGPCYAITVGQRDRLAFAIRTLQSAQAASDGKEQGAPRQLPESPEDVERDVRRICEELDRGQQLTERDLELRVSSSSSATVRGPMEEAYGARREADDLIIVKLPGLEEFRISNEGAERLHADFAKICRAPSGIEGRPAREASKKVESEMWRLGEVKIEGDRGPNFKLPAVFHGGEEICHGADKSQMRAAKNAHNASIQRLASPPLPDNGEAVKTKDLGE